MRYKKENEPTQDKIEWTEKISRLDTINSIDDEVEEDEEEKIIQKKSHRAKTRKNRNLKKEF
jgi:hypothetical protein